MIILSNEELVRRLSEVEENYSRIKAYSSRFAWERQFVGSGRQSQVNGTIKFLRAYSLRLSVETPPDKARDRQLDLSSASGPPEMANSFLAIGTPLVGTGTIFVCSLLLGLKDFFRERHLQAGSSDDMTTILELRSATHAIRYEVVNSNRIYSIIERFTITTGNVIEKTTFEEINMDLPRQP